MSLDAQFQSMFFEADNPKNSRGFADPGRSILNSGSDDKAAKIAASGRDGSRVYVTTGEASSGMTRRDLLCFDLRENQIKGKSPYIQVTKNPSKFAMYSIIRHAVLENNLRKFFLGSKQVLHDASMEDSLQSALSKMDGSSKVS